MFGIPSQKYVLGDLEMHQEKEKDTERIDLFFDKCKFKFVNNFYNVTLH